MDAQEAIVTVLAVLVIANAILRVWLAYLTAQVSRRAEKRVREAQDALTRELDRAFATAYRDLPVGER